MNIIDKKGLLTQEMRGIIEEQANVMFRLGKYSSLNNIHDKLDVDIIIEDNCPDKGHVQLEEALKLKLLQIEILKKQERDSEEELIAQRQILEEHIERLKRIRDNIVTLGQYNPIEKNIYLYIKTITSFNDWQKYLKTTYIHEMLHAYFDRKKHYLIPYYYQIEEPLAEAGVLLYLHETNDNILSWAVQNIKNKMPLLAEYAFGAELYEMWINGHFALETIIKNFKFEVSDNPVNNATDVVSSIYTKTVSTKRDAFERWLIVVKGYAASSACNYACSVPNRCNLKDFIFKITNRRTSDFYKLYSTERAKLRGYLWREARLIDLYEEFCYTFKY